MGLCGNVFENLFKESLINKKAKFTHKCSKCGQVDEIESTVTNYGLDFGNTPGTGLGGLCPWNIGKGVTK